MNEERLQLLRLLHSINHDLFLAQATPADQWNAKPKAAIDAFTESTERVIKQVQAFLDNTL